MNAVANAQNGQPDAESIRAQVERMTKSHVFANSPQLSAFLVFVVEALLRGKAERLKGYTIGVEVLRRDVSFDPQIDPIVRVEATRLRRAIERYYAGPGASDAIAIGLPRGGYVPRISWRTDVTGGGNAGGAAAGAQIAPARAPVGNGFPTLRVAPFVVIGTPDTPIVTGETLGTKLAEAFAQFELINVVVASSSGGRSDYRLDGTIEYRGNGTVDLRFRLVDESDARVIWSRLFDGLSGEDSSAVEHRIIIELATIIVQPYGIIWAYDRARQRAGSGADPRYRCLIDAGEAFRSFDPAEHVRIRDELEYLTTTGPSFAAGASYLSIFYTREYLFGFGRRPDASPPLDRALKAARLGIELKPHSARAYHLLFIVLYFRNEIEAANAAARKAIALNRYDLLILADYGGRMLLSGDVDKGMAIVRDAIGLGAILPAWTHLYLFVGTYIRGDLAEARYHASQLTSEAYVFGHLARALIAVGDGDLAAARRLVQAILSLQPEWQKDPRGEIGKMVVSPTITDRLVRVLEDAGVLDSSNFSMR